MEEAQSLLRPSSSSEHGRAVAMPATKLARFRAYWLGSVVCIGGFLFGYDSGIVGGVLTLSSFERDYRYGAGADATRTSALSVALQQLGALAACFVAWPLTHRLGRRRALALASLVFCAGALVQTLNTHSLAAFYTARVVSGLGLGAATVVVPMFNSEMMPKDLRARVGSFFQWFFTFGIFTSYWVDYAVAKNIDSSASAQWQIPIGLQLIPGALLGLGMLTVRESTRWLTARGRHEEAWASLQWIRADSSEATAAEMDEIRAGVEAEAREREDFRLSELLQPDNFKRVFTAFAIFTAQQATGATAFAYFGPQYFRLLVGSSGGGDSGDDRALLLTAVFGAVKVVSCGAFVLWFSERLSRRQVLIGGAAVMAACQLTTAAVVRAKPPQTSTQTQTSNTSNSASSSDPIPPSGLATVGLIYLFVVLYNFSWGPLPWPYVSELFPARIREPGVAVGVAAQWLWNFVFSLATPYMVRGLGWGTFLLWGVFDVVIAVVAYFFLQETRGLSLEAIAQRGFEAGGRGEGRGRGTGRGTGVGVVKGVERDGERGRRRGGEGASSS